MCISHVILLSLTCIPMSLYRKWSCRVRFLQYSIAHIAFIRKDIGNGTFVPQLTSRRCIELLHYLSVAGARQVALKYKPHYLCFFWHYRKLSIFQTISKACRLRVMPLTFHPFLVAPAYIAGDGLALCLCKGCVQGGHQFGGYPCGVDVFFLEEDGRAVGSELPDSLQTLRRVAGEAGDGLDQNAVDKPVPTVDQHPLEVISLLH